MTSNIKKWENEFHQWEASGLARTEYCRKNNIKLSTFDYWRHRLKEITAKENKLVKLSLSTGIEPIAIELKNQIRIKIPENYNSDTLKKIISDLQDITRCF